MSAESPRRGVHKGAQVVSPQPIVDRSIIDSVAGIINDIVPQVCFFYIIHCFHLDIWKSVLIILFYDIKWYILLVKF